MSKPSLAGREHQQSSPFGLRHKQAKKNTEQTRHSCAISKKIRSKCAVSAPYPKKIRSKRATVAPYPKNTEQTRHSCAIFFLRDESYSSSCSCRHSWCRINTTEAFGLRKRSKTASGSLALLNPMSIANLSIQRMPPMASKKENICHPRVIYATQRSTRTLSYSSLKMTSGSCRARADEPSA